MFNMNKKGQIAIEILVVLSILVIGGIFVGVYYIQGIGQNQQNSSTTNSTLDSLVDNFTDPFDIPDEPDVPLNKVAAPIAIPSEGEYPVGTPITLVSQTDGAIIRYALNSSDVNESSPIFPNDFYLTEDVQISAIAYKTGMEPSSKVKFTYTVDTTSTLEFTNIKIDDGAIPTGVVANAPFTLKVVAEATVPSVRVSRVIIQKNGMDTDACKFLGVGAMGKEITCIDGICTDLGYLTNPEIADTSYSNNFKFSCNEPGTYSFTFTGVLKTDSAEYSHMTSSEAITIAPPIPNTIVAEIISPQDGLYYKDKPLILSSNIIGAEKEDLFCNWYATNKDTSASIALGDSCDLLYDLSNSADFEIDKTYEINLFVSEKEGTLYANASPKVITIVDVDSVSSKLVFDPASGQEANKYFTTTYYSREIAEFENGAYFRVGVADDSCNFELSRATPEMLVVIDSDEVSQVFYKYKFKSICSTPGVKEILLELYNSDGFGTRQIIEADTISANYEIFDEEVTVFTDFYFYFPQGPNIPSIEEFFDDGIQVKGKDPHKDVLYFLPPADQTVPNPDIEIPQGKSFYIYSYVDSDPSYYMAGQETCSIQFVPTNGNTQTKIQTFNQPCNSYRFYQPTLEGYYSAKFSVITPRGETVVKSKIVRFVPNPIAFAPSQDFGNLYYTGIDFPLNIRLINPTFTPVTMTYGLYVSSIDDPAGGYINNDGTSASFAAPEVFDPMDGYTEIVSGGSFTCSAPYLNCHTTIPGTYHDQHGVYKIKITASDLYSHSIDTWYSFRTSVPPEGAEIRTATGKTPTERKLTGVLYRHETIGGISRKIYNIGERCQWTINGLSINATACDLYYDFGTGGTKVIDVVVYENYSGLSPVSKTATKNVLIEYVPNAYNITVDTDYIEMGDDVQFKANYVYPASTGLNEVLAENCSEWKVDDVIMPGTADCTYNHYFTSPGEYELVATVYFAGAATEVSKTVYVYGTQVVDDLGEIARCTHYYHGPSPGDPWGGCNIYQLEIQYNDLLINTLLEGNLDYIVEFRNTSGQPLPIAAGYSSSGTSAIVQNAVGQKRFSIFDYIELDLRLNNSISYSNPIRFDLFIQNESDPYYGRRSGTIDCLQIYNCP